MGSNLFGASFDFNLLIPDPAKCLQLSLDHDFTFYDAAYLALALGQTNQLWTLDCSLAKVAGELKVTVEPIR